MLKLKECVHLYFNTSIQKRKQQLKSDKNIYPNFIIRRYIPLALIELVEFPDTE